ncbi:hypothetical protein COLO4_04524 [Corchorus olitorius]|uniref:Uncharacterized protein n=1 Tax=Corchorus olitorius TaxID=93759 RepID=A0A1R3KTL8_9ROSI|nr:hypothetical protein COLO4_04524 [Corchorus olitorius]
MISTVHSLFSLSKGSMALKTNFPFSPCRAFGMSGSGCLPVSEGLV